MRHIEETDSYYITGGKKKLAKEINIPESQINIEWYESIQEYVVYINGVFYDYFY